MLKVARLFLMAAVLALGGAQTARADIILTFKQEGGITPVPTSPYPAPVGALVEMSLVLTDDAFNDGASLSLYRPNTQQGSWILDGLVQIYVKFSGAADPFDVNVWHFMFPPGLAFARIDLDTYADGLPTGLVHYRHNAAVEVFLYFNGTTSVTGYLAGDGVCFLGCNFSGSLVQSVPEPATILTFGIGLLALAGVRRRLGAGEA